MYDKIHYKLKKKKKKRVDALEFYVLQSPGTVKNVHL